MIGSIDTRIRVAYIVVLIALGILGIVVDFSFGLGAIVGVLAMLPVVVADFVISRRRRNTPAA
jgi:F0F1-type ATP synthase assembly protein I